MDPEPSPKYEILFRSFSRYLKVTPHGFQLPTGKIVPSLSCQILSFRPARTFYQNRKPICRSLEGLQSLKEGRACASCLLRKGCTPQIYLELLWEGVPLSLLLAYTSARNFLTFQSTLCKRGEPVENAMVLMDVLDRGRWGEVRFGSKPSGEN